MSLSLSVAKKIATEQVAVLSLPSDNLFMGIIADKTTGQTLFHTDYQFKSAQEATEDILNKIKGIRGFIEKMPQPPRCNYCDKLLVKKMATIGQYANKAFCGCPDYPRCRGTVLWK